MSERILTYHEAIREALQEEMEDDARVFLLGEDIGIYGGVYKVTEGFLPVSALITRPVRFQFTSSMSPLGEKVCKFHGPPIGGFSR